MHKYISLDYLLSKADTFPFSYRTVYSHILENAPCVEMDSEPSYLVRTSLYDQEEIHRNCTVQIWSNSVTGESSIGWWENDPEPEDECGPYNEPED